MNAEMLNEDQSRAEWVRLQMFSARRTVDLKARRVEVNQGFRDLDEERFRLATG